MFAAVKKQQTQREAKGRQRRGRQQALWSRLQNYPYGCLVQDDICRNQRKGSKRALMRSSVMWMYTTGFALEAMYKKECVRQQAAPSSVPSESGWNWCPRRHLLDQRTHIIPVIASSTDTTNYGPHVSKHSHTWSSTEACDSQGVTGLKFVWQPGWGVHWPQGSATRSEEFESKSLTSLPPPQRPNQDLCPPQSDKSGLLAFMVGKRWFSDPCAVLLAAVMLTAGLWPPRFSKVALNRTQRQVFFQGFFSREG